MLIKKTGVSESQTSSRKAIKNYDLRITADFGKLVNFYSFKRLFHFCLVTEVLPSI